MHRLPITSLVDDEPPEPALRACRPEVGEVERQDRKPLTLGHRHHACIRVAELEIREGRIDLDGTATKTGGDGHSCVLVRNDRREEGPCGVASEPGAEELIDLDHNRLWHEQVTAELGDERGGKAMRFVPPVCGGDERPGVGDDSQRAVTSSRR